MTPSDGRFVSLGITPEANPARGDEGIGEALRMLTRARCALDAAAVACGLDPEDWAVVVDPSRCTPENRRRLAEVVDRVCRQAVLKAREAAR